MGVVRRLVLFPALMALMAAGCGDGQTTLAPSSGPPSTDPAPELADWPSGPDQLVLRIERGGGDVPEASRLTAVPGLSVYGDGTALLVADQDSQSERVVTPEQTDIDLGELWRRLNDAKVEGAFDPVVDRDHPNVFDAGTTSVEVVTVDGSIQVSAYALDWDDDDLSLRVRRAREQLRALIDDIETMAERGGAVEAWAPERYAVFSRPLEREQILELDAPPDRWPFGDLDAALPPESTRWRCLVVTGADAAGLQAEVDRGADLNGSSWSSASGQVWSVAVRPLLPDQRRCDP